MECRCCRFCRAQLKYTFVDLGLSPLSNSYVKPSQLNQMEPFYPLRVFVCDCCLLVQAEDFESPENIFSNYAYFSSYSDTWLQHARAYAEMSVERFGLGENSLVIEVASNDGYLLQYFVEKGIPVLGVEPAGNVAETALKKGIPTQVKFLGEKTAHELVARGAKADLLVGNNVLAHVPDLNDFLKGLKALLKPQGVITLEFAYLAKLIEENQFDTIYHEHFSYFTLLTSGRVLLEHGLTVFDVEELPTHGGSLRLYVRHTEDDSRPVEQRVYDLLAKEEFVGLSGLEGHLSFGERVKGTKYNLLKFLIEVKQARKSIAGYGAPAKGNTLLNYCGIRTDFLDFTVDRNPQKVGCYLPGTHIPICHPDKIREVTPDYVLILPWNLKDEIMGQMSYIRDWGGQFLVPIPEVQVLP